MKKRNFILLLSVLVLSLVSCKNEIKAPSASEPAPSSASSSLQFDIQAMEEPDDAELKDFVVDATGEYADTVILTPNEDVTNVRYLSLDTMVGDNGALTFSEVEILYNTESIRAGESVAISMEFPEIIPNRGLTLFDRAGTQHHYYFSESGEDGHPLLTEYFENQ